MAVKVAINGFGRIGRLAFRQMFDLPEFEIVAINDLTDAKALAYLLKYDSAQGRWRQDAVSAEEGHIVVDGKKVKVFAEKNPADLPWKELGVDVVLECTGLFTSKDKAQAHIDAGARRVVISAPAGSDTETIVYNVNHETLDGAETIISAASCTTNCLAPMAKALHDAFNIEAGLMTTIHAYTNDQNTLDGPHKKDFRRGRAAAENIVPNSTGAAKAIGLVIPELAGKLDGAAQRVPVITGSATELTVVCTKKGLDAAQVNEVMKNASNESFGYTDEDIVSSDVIGITYGSLFDATQTKVMRVGDVELVKVVAWYDNENSYVSQMVRTVKFFGSKI